MEKALEKLYKYVEMFLKREIDGQSFEKLFSECYDFDEIDESTRVGYIEGVRQLLERFSPYEKDLNTYPEYYIGEDKLRKEIVVLRDKVGR